MNDPKTIKEKYKLREHKEEIRSRFPDIADRIDYLAY